jgi:hypothetical protein
MLAGMKSEQVAGFVSESMAGFIGIRNYWFRESARQDVFLDCNEEKGVGYCTGFVDLKDLGLSVRYHFSYPLVSRNDEGEFTGF